jgi:XRE family aerobic/anaerobic benzoate catabolism transcriptional regulator
MTDLRALGDAVRDVRTDRGLTQRELADRSGVSLRFLSDLEAGRGNISIARLLEVARALEVQLVDLVAPLDRAAIRTSLDRPLALVGLRGAGKSTIGAQVAELLKAPFVELDLAIEEAAGLPLSQIFEIHGDSYYRRLERAAVERLIKKGARPSVVAAGGGIVMHTEAWPLLKRRARTVWLRAKPEEHYQRVMEQGDLRPMQNRPAAMAELHSILELRSPRYAEAELTVDTSALGLDGSVARIVRWIQG